MGDRLSDKTAIVTGAGSVGPGIGNGKAAAMLFAREGARVMLVDYNLDAAEETKRLIEGEGGTCFTSQADVSSAADCEPHRPGVRQTSTVASTFSTTTSVSRSPAASSKSPRTTGTAPSTLTSRASSSCAVQSSRR